jgi:hypothetical protein
MAMLIGTRLLKTVRRELDCARMPATIWGDNQIVLHWVYFYKDKDIFVTNRLKEIRTADARFRFVPTQENPADLAVLRQS